MLPRVANLVRKNLLSLKNRGAHNRFMSDAPALRHGHMNDLPIPHEPFSAGYKRRQVGNNFVLLFGIVFCSASIAYVTQTGLIITNLTPPKKNLGEF